MSKKDQLAAVSEAIDAVAPEPTEPVVEEPTTPETEPTTPDPEDNENVPTVPEDEGGDEPDDEGGEPDPETPEPEGDDEPDDKPGAEDTEGKDKPEKVERPSDEFGELPADAKKETRERFDKMRSGYDKLHGELEAANQRIDEMVGVVTRTGATGEQFDATLQYLGARNSGNPAMLEQAYGILKAEFEEVSKLLGKPVPGVSDPLEGHADLQAEVEAGEISQARAEEIAAARTRDRLNTDFSKRQQETSSREQALTQAYEEIASLGATLREQAPEKYTHHLDTIKAIASMAEQSGRPPSEWPAMIKAQFDRLPDPPPKQVKPRAPNPVRPGGMTGAPGGNKAHKEASNAVEAMDMALGL